jgi:hypothetical protein
MEGDPVVGMASHRAPEPIVPDGTEPELDDDALDLDGSADLFDGHPDLAEIRWRHERILGGRHAGAISGLVLMAGLYLAISPWAIGFRPAAARLVPMDLMLGVAVVAVGLGLAFAPIVMYRLSWAMVGIGGWVIVAPWLMATGTDDSRLLASHTLSGLVTIALGLSAVAIAVRAVRQRQG